MRRYVAALPALDIPVEGQRGVGGGYRIRPGYRLPPLMLTDDEAVAIVLGLIGARVSPPMARPTPWTARWEKILRVLPGAPARARWKRSSRRSDSRAPAPRSAPVGGVVALLLGRCDQAAPARAHVGTARSRASGRGAS